MDSTMALEHRSKVTRKGQVTVPAEVRKALGLQRGDGVSFFMKNGTVHIAKSRSVAEMTAGSLRNPKVPFAGVRAEREAFERLVAEEVAGEGLH
jgi:AbrB family looped-hinge helix DNA binding protein